MLSCSILVQFDNAFPHIAAVTSVLSGKFGLKAFDHLLYGSDLTPSDFHLFTQLKEFLV
jgi:hypothetical protein